MLIYTSVFTLPFIYFLLVFYQNGYTFSLLPFRGESISVFSTILFFLVFGVKLPIYGLHFWLPMAHVEAPTFGSIILAGVLLKLGGVGLIRVLPFLNIFILKYFVLSYLIFFTIYTILVCCSQSDFKRLVAYSSVSHIIIIPLLLLTNDYLRIKIILVSMFFHGLSSPLMFVLVGIFYSLFSSRQLVFIRGLLLLSPLLSFLVVISFFISISAPPFPSFVSEVYSFISIYSVTFYSFILFILVPFFSLIYNII
jgi:NADH:ubiquinone oxidoreductase subunit 4 (subunit M)